MTCMRARTMPLLAALLTFAMAIPAAAQVFKTIASFTEGNGANPSLVQGTDGSFYGTQYGSPGSVFRVTPTGDITVLHYFEFDDDRGYYPMARLVLAPNGRFYGNTAYSTSNSGTIFSIASDGAFKTLYDFCPPPSPCTNGATPVGGLLQADRGQFLYGTTDSGGDLTCNAPDGCGTIFKITSSGSLTTLHNFDFSNGGFPMAPLIQGFDGTLYGTTLAGGKQLDFCAPGWGGCGTLFKTTPSGQFSILHKFCSQRDCADGFWPLGIIEATDGAVYGVTEGGCGTIYKIAKPGTLKTLHWFDGAHGCNPATLVQATDGNFYGVTVAGGSSNWGTIFSITPAGKLTTLYTFCAQTTFHCKTNGP